MVAWLEPLVPTSTQGKARAQPQLILPCVSARLIRLPVNDVDRRVSSNSLTELFSHIIIFRSWP